MLQGLNQKGSSAGDHDGSDKAASTGGKWHTDQRSGDATALDDGTHRFIANFCGGGDARLSFRWRDDLNEDSWVDVHYETGSMVGVDLDALTDELIEHKHTSCGRMSISFCYNVLVDDIITAATPGGDRCCGGAAGRHSAGTSLALCAVPAGGRRPSTPSPTRSAPT